jgi:hypothetical protein
MVRPRLTYLVLYHSLENSNPTPNSNSKLMARINELAYKLHKKVKGYIVSYLLVSVDHPYFIVTNTPFPDLFDYYDRHSFKRTYSLNRNY